MTESLPLPGALALAALVRERRPVVHCITNLVTIDWVARGLAAAGASPIMAMDACEVGEIAAKAGALVFNLGTWRPELLTAMLAAGEVAASRGVPIVLDPVGVGGTQARTSAALTLLQRLPVRCVRGNAAEVAALAGVAAELKGIEAGKAAAGVAEVAALAAARWQTTVICTGPTDVVADGGRLAAGPGAGPLLAAVVGAGCLLTALAGAVLAANPERSPFEAAAATLAWHGACAAAAGADGQAPGTFTLRYLDALHADPHQYDRRAQSSL